MNDKNPQKSSSQIISIKGLPGFALAVILLCLAIFVGGPFIESLGSPAGTAAGSAVGAAQGSYRGVTEGIASGQQDGIHDGLSADDTQTQIYNRLQEIANLEVLIVGNSFTNVQTIGKNEYEYAVMYQFEGEGVWTVNLKTASISVDSDHRTVNVSLAPPEIQSNLDDTKKRKVAEYQKGKNTGSIEKGIEANQNARQAVEQEYRQSLIHDSDLMAKESAQKQLTRLIGNICRNSMKVDITFTDER